MPLRIKCEWLKVIWTYNFLQRNNTLHTAKIKCFLPSMIVQSLTLKEWVWFTNDSLIGIFNDCIVSGYSSHSSYSSYWMCEANLLKIICSIISHISHRSNWVLSVNPSAITKKVQIFHTSDNQPLPSQVQKVGDTIKTTRVFSTD